MGVSRNFLCSAAAGLLMLPICAAQGVQEAGVPQQVAVDNSRHNVILRVGGANASEVREALNSFADPPVNNQQTWQDLVFEVRELLGGPDSEALKEALLALLDIGDEATDRPPVIPTANGGWTDGEGLPAHSTESWDEASLPLATTSVPWHTSAGVGKGMTTHENENFTVPATSGLSSDSTNSDSNITKTRSAGGSDSSEMVTDVQPTLEGGNTPLMGSETNGECLAFGGPASLNCREVCEAQQLICAAEESRKLNANLADCVGAALDVYGEVTRALESEPIGGSSSPFGGGCLYRASTVRLLVGDFGCEGSVATASFPNLNRLCCCSPPGGAARRRLH